MAIAAILSVALGALADARTDYLIRALRTSDMFRVRAQAAASLGQVDTEPSVVQALRRALSDSHPAVRAAACASLERHGDPSALDDLRRAERDGEAQVRAAARRAVQRLEAMARSRPRTRSLPRRGSSDSGGRGNARYYVAVGTPGTKVRGIAPSALSSARAFIARTAAQSPGVEIAPENESHGAAQRVLDQRNLVGFYIDTSIVSIDERPGGGLRASVSVVLQSYPDRNIRSILNGAATVMGASGATAQTQAIQGALNGALRNLPQAMEAGAASASASPPRRRRGRR